MSRPKRSNAFKLEMVTLFINSNLSNEEFARRHNLNAASLLSWLRRYNEHGDLAFVVEHSVTTRYDLAFKLAVLQTMKDECLSIAATSSRFNIAGKSTVSDWLKRYEAGGKIALENKRNRTAMPVNSTNKSTSDKNLTPEEKLELFEQQTKELEYLRAENAYLKKLDALMKNKRSATKKKR